VLLGETDHGLTDRVILPGRWGTAGLSGPDVRFEQGGRTMTEIEDQAEREAEQAAYDVWVAEARAHGLNGEADIFRAGWVAAREYSSTETKG
jgi:hypothetical protein